MSVLAPTESDDLPAYVVPAGRAVAVPYNGAVARMSFGPVVAARARRWLHEGHFDVLHLHEPATPSLSAARALGRRVPGRGDLPLLQRPVPRAVAADADSARERSLEEW